MAQLKHIFKGESLTMLFTFPESYDMARLQKHEVYINDTAFTGVVSGQAIELKLTSEQTDAMYGNQRISVWIDDTQLGVRKPYVGDLVVSRTNATPDNDSTSEVTDIIVPIVISETAITVGDILYNYVKGDRGKPFLYSDFTPAQIAELQQPAAEAIASIEAVELAVETAEVLRVQAEQSRQTNTATAIQNAENATTVANNAASLANEKAGLANNAALLANEKAGLAATATTQANTARDGANSAAQSATNLVNSYATDLAAKVAKTDIEQVRSQATNKVASSKLLDDELNILNIKEDSFFGFKKTNRVSFPNNVKRLIFDAISIQENKTFRLKVTIPSGETTAFNAFYLYYNNDFRYNDTIFTSGKEYEFVVPSGVTITSLSFLPSVVSSFGDIEFDLSYEGIININIDKTESRIKEMTVKTSKSYQATQGITFSSGSDSIHVNIYANKKFYVYIDAPLEHNNSTVYIYTTGKFAKINFNELVELSFDVQVSALWIGGFTPTATEAIRLDVYATKDNLTLVDLKNANMLKGTNAVLSILTPKGVYQNETTLFTKDDIAVGKKIYYDIEFNDLINKTRYLYICLYDSSGNVLAQYGKTTSGTTSDEGYKGIFVIPINFDYAKIIVDAPNKYSFGKVDYIYTEDFPTAKLESGLSVYDTDIQDLKELTSVDRISESPEVLYAETDSNDRELRIVTKDAEVHCQKQKFNNTIELNKKAYNSVIDNFSELGIPRVDSICFGTPEVVMSTKDSGVTVWDDFYIGYTQVVKIKEDLYYLYYESNGSGGWVRDNPETIGKMPQSMLFAHSSDGVHWTRGFPQGVEPPFGEDAPYSVKFIDSLGRTPFKPANCVFLVNDSEYPFRCVTSEGSTSMYKSADGFTFTEICLIEDDQQRDTQPGVILRGDVVKLYHRGWEGSYPMYQPAGYGTRTIVVEYCDINGNLICNESPMMLEHYYNSAASRLDDRREILFPTYYQGDAVPISIDCYVVDGSLIKKVDIDGANLLGKIDNVTFKWALVQSNIIAIGGKMYLYYYGLDATHNNIPKSNVPRTSQIRRVEVRFNCSKLRYKQPSLDFEAKF